MICQSCTSIISLLFLYGSGLPPHFTLALSGSKDVRNSFLWGSLSTLSQPGPRVAVIGSGAAGLACARVLSRSGYHPFVLEKDQRSGGVWNYKAKSKTRPMYRGLRTNLPKEIMAFREFPFPPFSDDPLQDPSFLTHAQVLHYLELYEKEFDLTQYIQHNCKVCNLEVVHDENAVSCVSPPSEVWPQFRLEWKEKSPNADNEPVLKADIFDAVLVCNGHYAKPSIPEIPGSSQYFKGRTLHSIEYDNPQEFEGQRVVCVGARASGEDLAREISMYASKVFLASSTCPRGKAPKTQGKVTLVPRMIEVEKDGSVRFDGYSETIDFDVLIYCTGYDYDFPFINDNDLLAFTAGERRVQPLFEQLFHAKYPNMCCTGLPHSILPFPLFELQAEAIVAIFSDCKLPTSISERMESAAKDALGGGPGEGGRVPQDTHYLGSYQWDYMRMLAKLGGVYDDEFENYLTQTKLIWDHSSAERKGRFPGGPDEYREILYQRDISKSSFSIRNVVQAPKS